MVVSKTMATAGVIHWRAEEAGPLIEVCRKAGLTAEHLEGGGIDVCRAVRAKLPDVVLIDLSRLPSHGREVGRWLRRTKATRAIPLVFVGGDPEKVDKVREIHPGSLFCDLKDAGRVAKRAVNAGPQEDVAVRDVTELYRERSAAQKLGIKAGAQVCVKDAPRGFPELLGVLPNDVEFQEEPAPLTLWFVEEPDALMESLNAMRQCAGRTKLWVLWRKGVKARDGLTQNSIREALHDVGLVFYKICAVDARWSGMLFSRKDEGKSLGKTA